MGYGELSQIEVWGYATLLLIGRYLLIAGVFYAVFYVICRKFFLALKIQRKFPGRRQLLDEIKYSLMTFLIYGGSIGLFLYWIDQGMTLRYETIDTYGVPYFVLSIIMMIFLHDTYFYWTHRLMHHPRVFPLVHRTHHRFNTPTPWAAFAFHPLETILSMGIIPLIIFTMPYHQWALVCFITFMVVFNVVIHLGFHVRAFSVTKYQNTALDHDYHHRKGHGNYGLYFKFWDLLMGTMGRENRIASRS